jgi:hypothetical protein
MGGLKKFLQADLQKFAVPQSKALPPSQAYDFTRTTVLSLNGAARSVLEGQASSPPTPLYTFETAIADPLFDTGPDEGLLDGDPSVNSDDPCEPRRPNQVCHNQRYRHVELMHQSEN